MERETSRKVRDFYLEGWNPNTKKWERYHEAPIGSMNKDYATWYELGFNFAALHKGSRRRPFTFYRLIK